MFRRALARRRMRRSIKRHVRAMRERMGVRSTRCPILLLIYAARAGG